MKYYTPSQNDGNHIFVFGSNLAGIHGAGAALQARKHWGAQLGVGHGMTGMSYAIPTKDEQLRTLPLEAIEDWVREFKHYARCRPGLTFLVTPIGCGLAGYFTDQIAPMFRNSPPNCVLPEEFKI